MALITKVFKIVGGLLSRFSTTIDSHMTLYAAVLLSMGYPVLLYVKSLNKIALLEERIIQLEKRSSDSYNYGGCIGCCR